MKGVAALLPCLLLPAVAWAQAPPPDEVPPPPPPAAYGGEAPVAREPVPPPPGATAQPIPPPPGATPPPVPPPPAPPPPAAERDPDLRSGVEIAELYVASFAWGALASASVMAAFEADGPYLYLSLPVLGGMLGIAGVLVLDQDPGMPTGVPSAITTGMAIGLVDGLVLWGALDEDLSAAEVLGLVVAGSGVGAIVGGLVGYGLRPSVRENRLTLSMALWSGFIAATAELAFGTPADANTWRMGLAGVNVGAGLGVLLGAAGDLSMEQVGLVQAMTFSGALVGLGIAGLVHHDAERDGRPHGAEITAAGVSIGAGSGLLLSLLVLGLEAGERGAGDSERDAEGEVYGGPQASALAPSLAAVPLRGGGVVTVAWTL